MRVQLVMVGILCAFTLASANGLEVHTAHYTATVPSDTTEYQVVIHCDDAALIHDISIYNGHSGPNNTIPDSFPIVLHALHPLTIPVSVYDDAALHIDMTYTSDSECVVREGLHGIMQVGLVLPDDDILRNFANEVQDAIMLGINDFNQHLEAENHPWSLQVTPIHYNDTLQNNISLILDPITDFEHHMFDISCCTSGIIRDLYPSDESTATAFGAVIYDDDMHGLVILYNDATKLLLNNLTSVLNDMETVPVSYDAETQVQRIIYETSRMSDKYGVEHVGVVVLGSGGEYQVLVESSQYDALRKVHWYVSDSAIGLVDILKSTFAQNVVGVRPDAPYTLKSDIISEKYGDDTKLYHYLAYDSVWILGNTLLLSQSTNPHIMDAVMPAALSYHTTLSGLVYNGTEHVIQYGIWGVVADEWTRIGTYDGLTGDVSYNWWYPKD